MLSLLNLDDDDLSKIRRSMNFYSILVLAIWWKCASVDFSKFGFITLSGPVENWHLKSIITIIILYLAVRQHYVYPWTLNTVAIELEKENKKFKGTVSELASAFDDFSQKLEKTKIINIQELVETSVEWKKAISDLSLAKDKMEDGIDSLRSDYSNAKLSEQVNRERTSEFSLPTQINDKLIDAASKWIEASDCILRSNIEDVVNSLQDYSAIELAESAKKAMKTILEVVPEMQVALKARKKDLTYFGLYFPRAFAAIVLIVVWLIRSPSVICC